MDNAFANIIDPDTGKRIKLHENVFYLAALRQRFLQLHNERIASENSRNKKIPKVVRLRDKTNVPSVKHPVSN